MLGARSRFGDDSTWQDATTINPMRLPASDGPPADPDLSPDVPPPAGKGGDDDQEERDADEVT